MRRAVPLVALAVASCGSAHHHVVAAQHVRVVHVRRHVPANALGLFFRASLGIRKRALWALCALAVYALAVVGVQRIPGVPLIRFDGSSVREIFTLITSFARRGGGSGTPTRPVPVISKTASSFVEPKRFLAARRTRCSW